MITPDLVTRNVPWTLGGGGGGGGGGEVSWAFLSSQETSIFKHIRLSTILVFPYFPLGKFPWDALSLLI